MFSTLCLGCTGYAHHVAGRGWVHSDGHGAIWQRCACGWSGSEASRLSSSLNARAFCPWCGSIALTDDHAATPDRRTFVEAGNATIYLLVILLVALPLALFALRTAAEIGHALGGTP